MDPRLKMNYYKENEWEDLYILEAEKVVTNIWESTYKNNSLNDEQIYEDTAEDDLFLHIFKKQRTVRDNDELKTYLREPVVNSKTDVLLWWKVCPNKIIIIIIYIT